MLFYIFLGDINKFIKKILFGLYSYSKIARFTAPPPVVFELQIC